jgi:hypothetical protein
MIGMVALRLANKTQKLRAQYIVNSFRLGQEVEELVSKSQKIIKGDNLTLSPWL